MSKMIVWRDEMSVGFPSIDEDHQKLFSIINEFELTKTLAAAETCAKRLFTYTELHFRAEENIQDEYGYPLREQQKEEHKQIINDLRKLVRQSFIEKNVNENVVIEKLSEMLRGWILGHVLQCDLKMKPFFRTHPLRKLV